MEETQNDIVEEQTPPSSPIEKKRLGRPRNPIKEKQPRKPQTEAQLANLARGRQKASQAAAARRAAQYEADLEALEDLKEPEPARPVKRARKPVKRLPAAEAEEEYYEEEPQYEEPQEELDTDDEMEAVLSTLEQRIYNRMQEQQNQHHRQTPIHGNTNRQPVRQDARKVEHVPVYYG